MVGPTITFASVVGATLVPKRFHFKPERDQRLLGIANSIDVFRSTNRSFSTPEKPAPRPRFMAMTPLG
jgi:hypothetical protein